MAKPVVDGLERDLEGKVRFARIDVGSDVGAAAAHKYGIAGTPSFLLLDAEGRVIYRKVGGRPDVAEVKARLAR